MNKSLFKFFSYALGVAILVDIGVIVSYFLKNITGNRIQDINRAAIVFFLLTLILAILKYYFKKSDTGKSS